jgi:phosphatidate phosphatase APP1
MTNRHAAAALSVLMFVLAGVFAFPAHAAGTSPNLLAAVKNVSSESDKFRSMMANLTETQIHVVNAQSAMSPSDAAAFKVALRKNASGISDLRDTLNHTTLTGADGVLITLRKVLQRQNVTIDQVVGVHVGDDGQITLFYQ